MNSQPDNFFPQKNPYCYGPSNISSTKPIVSSSKQLTNKQSINSRERRSNESTKELQQKIDLLESQLVEITNVLEQQGSYAQALEELNYENKQLKSKIKQQQQLLQTYSEQIQKQEKNNEQLKIQLQKMGDEMSSLGKEIMRNSHNKHQQQKIKNLYQSQISSLKQKYQISQQNFQQLIKTNQITIDQYNQILKINQELKQANQTQHTLLTELQQLLPNKQQQIQQQDRCLQQTKLELQSKDKLIQQLNQKIKSLQQSKQSHSSHASSEIYELKSQLSQLRMQNSQLMQTNELVKKKYESMLVEVETQLKTQIQLNNKYKVQHYKQQSQIKEIEFHQTQNKKSQENQTKFWKEKQAYYMSEIQKLRQMLVSMESEKNILNIQHHSCESIIEQMQRQLSDCYQNLHNQQKQYEALNQKLKSTIKGYDVSIQAIKNKFNNLQAQKSGLLKDFKENNNKAIILQQKYTQIASKYEQRQVFLKNIIKQLQEAHKTNKQLQSLNQQNTKKEIQNMEKIQNLTMQIQDLQKRNCKLQKQVNFQKIQRASLDSTILQTQQHVKILQIQHSQLQQKYNQSLQQLQMHKQNKKQYQKRLDAHIQKMQQQLEQKKQQIKKYQLAQVQNNKILMQKQYEIDRTKAEYVNQIDQLLIENKFHRQNIEKLIRGENINRTQLENLNGFTFSLGGRQISQNIIKNKSNQQLVHKLQQENTNLKKIINELKKEIYDIQQHSSMDLHNNISVNKFTPPPRSTNDTHTHNKTNSRNLYSNQKTENHSEILYQDQESSQEKIQILEKRLQRANNDITKLDKAIQSLLIQHQITPRDGNCTIHRTIWLIDILSTQMLQYKNDTQILRKQKRAIAKDKQKLIHLLEQAETQKEKLQFQIEQIKHSTNYQNYSKHQSYRKNIIKELNSYKKIDPNSYMSRNQSQGNIQSRFPNNYTQNQQRQSSNGKNKSFQQNVPKLKLSQDDESNFRQERRKLFGKVRKQIMGVFDS